MKRLLILLVLIITLLATTVNAETFFEGGKNLYSENVYMVHLGSGRVMYELDSEELVYPASLTKIMTCIVAIEHSESLDETVTIPSGIFGDIYAEGGANMALKAGEEISVGDLVRATMIRSTCDTASALAYHISGSIEEFAKLMNEKALEIGASNTHFVNAHGLHNDNHYTTAKDMFLIAEYALKNQIFCDIISEHSCTIPPTNMSEERVLPTTIEIEDPSNPLYYPYVTGIKSGFTDQAGRCLITKATKNGETYLLVTLGANLDRYYEGNMAFTDAVTLFEYFFAQYSTKTLASPEVSLGEVAVKGGIKDTVTVYPKSEIKALIALNEDAEIVITPKKKLKAPIEAGDTVGTATVTVGEEVFKTDLIADEYIEASGGKKTLEDFNGGNMLATAFDIAAIALVTLSVIIFILLLIKMFKKKK